jgi:putative membrane protein
MGKKTKSRAAVCVSSLSSARFTPYARSVAAGAISSGNAAGGGGAPASDRNLYLAVAAISAVAVAAITWVLYLRDRSGTDTARLAFMPAVNASLNAVAAAAQVMGFLAIRAKKQNLHRGLMLTAFGASALFFLGYLAYHYIHGDTHYPGAGPMKIAYIALLITHVVASIALVPMVLITLFNAVRGRFAAHRKLARFTLPVWLYVSVTGVLVFVMLRSAF